MVAVDQPLESVLQCKDCTGNYGDSEPTCIVSDVPGLGSRSCIEVSPGSVSSVKTLEEAKVAKSCLYVQIPVDEVNSTPWCEMSADAFNLVWDFTVQQV